MAAMVTAQLAGLDSLTAKLAELDDKLEKQVVTNAMRAAMQKLMKPAIVAASPTRKDRLATKKRRKSKLSGKTLGPLKSSWSVMKARGRKGQIRFVLKSNTPTRDAFYALFLEKGWQSGRRVTKRQVRKGPPKQRRAIPARPFIVPAAERAFQTVIDATLQAASIQAEALIAGLES